MPRPRLRLCCVVDYTVLYVGARFRFEDQRRSLDLGVLIHADPEGLYGAQLKPVVEGVSVCPDDRSIDDAVTRIVVQLRPALS